MSKRGFVGRGAPNTHNAAPPREDARKKKSQQDVEIKQLEQRILAEAPAPGTLPAGPKTKEENGSNGAASGPALTHKLFTELPLSKATLKGLGKCKFTKLTEIQRAAIPHALTNRDILGAARTGSGKTLAFLIPIIEKLYRHKWTPLDGLGALILSPTRELSMQIFEVLRQFACFHDLSAGLVIGGKDLRSEQERILRMNILICTPGRLLQHMDETPGFDCSNLQILVLDEADRILDLGFEKTVNAIVANLPPSRQTMLFSATLSKSVRNLARLSLKDPEYVAVHESARTSTPSKLEQHYMIVELGQKLDVLFSFIKSHIKSKIIVFLSSAKQVRFVYESFRRLRPGVPLMELHGRQKQNKRMAIYYDFLNKSEAVLFSTDVAARGVDFPAVDWVVQADCPEDVDTYVHRVGRTARYQAKGHALLLLLPSEQKMVELLEARKIPMKRIQSNPAKLLSIRGSLQAFLAQEPELKHLAQKSFISYMRSVFLMNNKEVFNVEALPASDLSDSLGLASPPEIKYGSKAVKKDKNTKLERLKEKIRAARDAKRMKRSEQEGSESSEGEGHSTGDDNDSDSDVVDNDMDSDEEERGPRGLAPPSSDDEDDEEESEEEEEEQKAKKRGNKFDRLQKRKNNTILSDHYAKLHGAIKDESEDDLIVVKRVDHDIEGVDSKGTVEGMSKKKLKKIKIEGLAKGENRKVFDEEGNALKPLEGLAKGVTGTDEEETGLTGMDVTERGLGSKRVDAGENYLRDVSEALREQDTIDRETERQRVKDKHKKRKLKERKRRREDQDGVEGPVAMLGGSDSEQEEHDAVMYESDEQGSEPAAESASEEEEKPRKKQKHSDSKLDNKHRYQSSAGSATGSNSMSVDDQEALALRILRGRK
eukprot:GILJ01006502.1.p1 GENE.GILJ01006502.1~~GILJ01006502.1.p1  ORF type:complete len:882 (+),score=196.31 GILJ01006502.1:48-2693(+)